MSSNNKNTINNVFVRNLVKTEAEWDNWSNSGEKLGKGQIGFLKDTTKYKVGDSSSPWNDLEYSDKELTDFLSTQTFKQGLWELGEPESEDYMGVEYYYKGRDPKEVTFDLPVMLLDETAPPEMTIPFPFFMFPYFLHLIALGGLYDEGFLSTDGSQPFDGMLGGFSEPIGNLNIRLIQYTPIFETFQIKPNDEGDGQIVYYVKNEGDMYKAVTYILKSDGSINNISIKNIATKEELDAELDPMKENIQSLQASLTTMEVEELPDMIEAENNSVYITSMVQYDEEGIKDAERRRFIFIKDSEDLPKVADTIVYNSPNNHGTATYITSYDSKFDVPITYRGNLNVTFQYEGANSEIDTFQVMFTSVDPSLMGFEDDRVGLFMVEDASQLPLFISGERRTAESNLEFTNKIIINEKVRSVYRTRVNAVDDDNVTFTYDENENQTTIFLSNEQINTIGDFYQVDYDVYAGAWILICNNTEINAEGSLVPALNKSLSYIEAREDITSIEIIAMDNYVVNNFFTDSYRSLLNTLRGLTDIAQIPLERVELLPSEPKPRNIYYNTDTHKYYLTPPRITSVENTYINTSTEFTLNFSFIHTNDNLFGNLPETITFEIAINGGTPFENIFRKTPDNAGVFKYISIIDLKDTYNIEIIFVPNYHWTSLISKGDFGNRRATFLVTSYLPNTTIAISHPNDTLEELFLDAIRVQKLSFHQIVVTHISSSWTTSDGFRTLSINIPGIKRDLEYFIDIDTSDLSTLEQVETAIEEYNKVVKIVAQDDTLIIYAREQPQAQFKLKIKVI